MRYLSRVLIISVALLTVGCRVEAPDFRGRVVSIAYLKSLYTGSPYCVNDNELVIYGTVVSSDHEGNFVKEIVIQDRTGAISISAEATRLCDLYPVGSNVALQCNGLTLGAYGGRMEIGDASDDARYQTGRIPASRLSLVMTHLIAPLESLEPLELQPADFTTQHIGNFIKVCDLQTAETATWAGDRVFHTTTGDSIVVRTQSSAMFANRRIPSYTLEVYAILGWFNGRYQLLLNSINDVQPWSGSASHFQKADTASEDS